jgi:hypothetical protein
MLQVRVRAGRLPKQRLSGFGKKNIGTRSRDSLEPFNVLFGEEQLVELNLSSSSSALSVRTLRSKNATLKRADRSSLCSGSIRHPMIMPVGDCAGSSSSSCVLQGPLAAKQGLFKGDQKQA